MYLLFFTTVSVLLDHIVPIQYLGLNMSNAEEALLNCAVMIYNVTGLLKLRLKNSLWTRKCFRLNEFAKDLLQERLVLYCIQSR